MNRQQIDIEYSSDKSYQTEYYHQSANDAVDDNDALLIPFLPDLVDKPCQTEPPENGAGYNTGISYAHHNGMVRDDEVEHTEQRHEQQYYQRITEGYQESRPTIVPQRSLVMLSSLMGIPQWIAQETVKTESEKH